MGGNRAPRAAERIGGCVSCVASAARFPRLPFYVRIVSMLIPKLTIRGILLSMIGFGFFFLVMADAVRGRTWAVATCLAVSTIAIMAVFFVVMFGVSYLLARLYRWLTSSGLPAAGSPFAAEMPPPQIVPPQEAAE